MVRVVINATKIKSNTLKFLEQFMVNIGIILSIVK